MRTVAVHLRGTPSRVGAFQVSRLFPGPGLERLDPFLFLDFFDAVLKPGAAHPDNAHPHRGFETVSVILRGEAGYRDSLGNHGVLETGSVEWMTAGSGIVHDGHGDHAFARTGGRITGIQLWVNLPRAKKMMPPAARYLPPATFPTVEGDGWTGRILAGADHGAASPVDLHVPLTLRDYDLGAGATVTVAAPREHSAFALVWDRALVGPDGMVGAGQLLTFHSNGDALQLKASPGGARVIVGTGQRLGEPVASAGPFVMSTEAELEQAYADYRAGRMGHL